MEKDEIDDNILKLIVVLHAEWKWEHPGLVAGIGNKNGFISIKRVVVRQMKRTFQPEI